MLEEGLNLLLAALLGALLPMRLRLLDAQSWQLVRAAALLSLSGALMLRIVDGEMARAFGLLGAASVVRYRYALASSGDASWLILALGMGMAIGSGLTALAVEGTALVILLNLIFDGVAGARTLGLRRSWEIQVRGRTAGLSGQAESWLQERGLRPRLIEVEVRETKEGTAERGLRHTATFLVSARLEHSQDQLVEGLSNLGAIEVQVKERNEP